MDLSTFANLYNPDEEIRNSSVNTINEAANDPSFISYLLTIIQTPESRANPTIFQSILITLVHTTRRHVSNFIAVTQNPEIKQTLIQILFSIPLEYRSHIEECLIIAAPSASDDFSQIFQVIFEKINPQSNIIDIYTAISFANKWIKRAGPTPFFTNFCQIILPFLQLCASNNEMTEIKANTISELAKLSKILISRGNVIFDDSLGVIFSIFGSFLIIPIQTKSGLTMKTNIAKLFSRGLRFIYELRSNPESEGWRQNFIQNVVNPVIFQNSLQSIQQPMDSNYMGRIFHLFYIFIYSEINPQAILTPTFFNCILVPNARLTSSDIQDYTINPIQYISFCCEHEKVNFYSPRICASQFLDVVINKYISNVDPLPLLLPEKVPTAASSQSEYVDFEARLYLLERYTMSFPLPPDVFECYFNMLTQEQPQYVVSALLRLVSNQMSKGDDSVVGIAVSEHYIINSVDPIAQMMGVRFMNKCFDSFGCNKLSALCGIIELNTRELFPILLNLSNFTCSNEPMSLIQKIFKIDPASYMDMVSELVRHFFAMWRENQIAIEGENEGESDLNIANAALMDSVKGIIDCVPTDSPLMQSLAVLVLQQLSADVSDFPNNSSISEQIGVAAVFSRKLTTPAEPLISFVSLIASKDLYYPAVIDNLTLLVCPLILNRNGGFDFFQFGVHQYLINLCQNILNITDDPDEESISKALIIASCLIQAKGEEYFPFVTSTIQMLEMLKQKNEFLQKNPIDSLKKKPIVVLAAVYLFTSALFVGGEKVQMLLIADIPELMCAVLPACCMRAAYRELKMAVTMLTWFAKFGHQQSFNVATALFKFLLQMKDLDSVIEGSPEFLNDRENLYRDEELISLAPLLYMPFDQFDELQFYTQFAAQNGVIMSVPLGTEEANEQQTQ